jgi:ubiquinone/menaquinone biosynthesis C-methylase UbiE
VTTGARQTEIALRTWERGAADYDRGIAKVERGLLQGAREWIGARATGRVLEVAVGTGRSLPFYAADAVVTGVDLSPATLAIARRRATGLRRDVDLRVGDAERLPFDDASFDTVVCALGLCAIPDHVTAIHEMRRVLVPGGRLLLLDHVRSTWPPVFVLQWLLERVTIRTAGEHFTRRPRVLVEAEGFEIVESQRSKAGAIELVSAIARDSVVRESEA